VVAFVCFIVVWNRLVVYFGLEAYELGMGVPFEDEAGRDDDDQGRSSPM
jgi:cytochrome bd-type quinol oxidase subunit 2